MMLNSDYKDFGKGIMEFCTDGENIQQFAKVYVGVHAAETEHVWQPSKWDYDEKIRLIQDNGKWVRAEYNDHFDGYILKHDYYGNPDVKEVDA